MIISWWGKVLSVPFDVLIEVTLILIDFKPILCSCYFHQPNRNKDSLIICLIILFINFLARDPMTISWPQATKNWVSFLHNTLLKENENLIRLRGSKSASKFHGRLKISYYKSYFKKFMSRYCPSIWLRNG